jgi:hypothetical protein
MGLMRGFIMGAMRMVGVGFPCRLLDGCVVVILAQEVKRGGEVMDEKEGGDQERTQNALPWNRRAPTASEATFANPAHASCFQTLDGSRFNDKEILSQVQ